MLTYLDQGIRRGEILELKIKKYYVTTLIFAFQKYDNFQVFC